MGSVMHVLNSLEDLETGMMLVYEWFADHFSDDKPVSLFFKEMCTEEKTHIGLVVFQKNVVRKNLKLFDKFSFDMKELDAMNREISDLLEEKPDLTLEAALDFSQRMETNACESMYKTLIIENCPELAPLIENLVKNNRFHFDRLKKARPEQ